MWTFPLQNLTWRGLGFVSYILAVVESYFWITFPHGTFNMTVSIENLSEVPVMSVDNLPAWFTLFSSPCKISPKRVLEIQQIFHIIYGDKTGAV
jgi:hypothetical protein